MIDFKICGWCGKRKELTCFYTRKKNGRETLRNECIPCYSEAKKLFYKNNIDNVRAAQKISRFKRFSKRQEYDKLRRIAFKDQLKAEAAFRYACNSEKVKNKRKAYYYRNKKKVIALNNTYFLKNKDRLRAAQRLNYKKRKQNDISFSITATLRSRVLSAIKNKGVKCIRTSAIIGCSVKDLMLHLESQFSNGMTWDNHGMRGWHIDHKIPCCKFDMSDTKEQLKCFNYKNLQPLWWLDNIKKGGK